MNRSRLGVVVALAIAVFTAAAVAQAPPHPSYVPGPPGTVIQSARAYLSGYGKRPEWRAVLSKAPIAKSGQRTFYQWYLSLYALNGNTYQLKYLSPRDGVPFTRVISGRAGNMWYPIADGWIVGAADLMRAGADQVVVASHAASADCGTARIDVFSYNSALRTVVPTLEVNNGCRLSATIVQSSPGAVLRVSGPYYGPDAALCCPTKDNASAIFRFHNGVWTQSPRYFTVLPLR